ncbi:MAG: precorrin-2 C(20)-methyltransferase [Kiloniellales bacterium]
MTGTLYGLGVGPGDPELITVKALRLLRAAAVIAYPAPDQGPSLVRGIVDGLLPGGQTEIEIRMPMLAERFPAQEVYARAAEEIGGHLAAGRDVAALCEGDPFFYGSFMYLFGRLAERFPVEVVPGVSSLMAAAAVLGAPLAARNDALIVLPATLSDAELAARIEAAEAVAFVKVGRHFERLKALIERLGLVERARYVEHATMASQRILPLAQAGGDKVPYFSMILLHKRGEAWK